MSTERKTDDLVAMRHSLAHIMAASIAYLWPQTKFGVGPVVDNGFYYDVDLGDKSLSEDDFATIEKQMRKLISAKQVFERFEMGIDEAIDWAKSNQQVYKLELLNDLKRTGTTQLNDIAENELGVEAKGESKVSEVSFYRNGDFVDLCRGPHLKSTAEAGAFKLMRISGAYWRGKDKNPQMQRIYGVAFTSDSELDRYIKMLEEAKLRDHRKLGQELDLFTMSDLVGAGLPLFTPRGTVLREKLGEFSQELQAQAGYQKVWTPHIAKEELYKASGHFEKFPERFSVTSSESDDKFMMKPMNCPHHIQIFLRKPWSYRELPVRYMENTTDYRDEKSGELHGLSRVRSFTQDDGHSFCRPEDIEQEVSAVVKIIKEFYDVIGMKYHAVLSFRDDSDKYLGDQKLWERAELIIEKIAKKESLDTVKLLGEAAFYGPKIDFMVRDSLDREWQCATVQLDFVQPDRFNLSYIDVDGSSKQPVIVHKALMGTIERFLSVYIEHTAGKFPVWLAPEQLRLLTINQEDEVTAYASDMERKAKKLGLRVTVDSDNESIGKKIRNAEVLKIPYSIVIGKNEIDSQMVTARIRKDLESNDRHEPISPDKLLSNILEESNSRVSKTSL